MLLVRVQSEEQENRLDPLSTRCCVQDHGGGPVVDHGVSQRIRALHRLQQAPDISPFFMLRMILHSALKSPVR